MSRETVTDALRWWERGRPLYNIVLLGYVLYRFGGILATLPGTLWLELAAAAAFANVLYCAAYPVDLLVQASDYRQRWRTFGRPLCWLIGMAVALILTHLTLLGLFKGA